MPIATYEDLEPYIKAAMLGEPNQHTKHPPVLFTTTSGTTGTREYIPMTRESRRSKARLTWLWLAALYRDHTGDRGRPDPQRGESRGRVVRPRRRPLRG